MKEKCCGNRGTSSGTWVAIFGGAFVAIFLPMLARLDGDGGREESVVEIGMVGEPGDVVEKEDGVMGDVLGYEMVMIDGEKKSLEDFRGSVILMVNVASKCGLTPQYEGLERLYQENKGRGFVVIGFPANQFAGQEPGTDGEIAEFCREEYGVSFPMTSKIVVKGEGIHPLYAQLTGMDEPVGGEISWNFDKFLVNRAGVAVERFGPRVAPEDKDLIFAIDQLLDEE